MQREKVLVIGGSITGLTAALALRAKNFDVTVIEADPSPSPDILPADSSTWTRRGAMHALQPHALTARLRNALREWYPDLVEDLLAAGVWEFGFPEMVHPVARARYQPQPSDADITILMSRRTTLELVMRRHVERQPGIAMLDGTRVMSLLVDRSGEALTVGGVRAADADGEHELLADVVVDASGRTTKFADELRAAGACIADEFHASNSVYYTRHYRLVPGQSFPRLYGLLAATFADFTVAAFPADAGAFVVTVAGFKEDPLLLGGLRDVRLFERICHAVPRVAEWIDPARSEPTTGVMGWANMDFLWRTAIREGEPKLRGFFFAGDTLLRSNPKYGRGCTCGTIGSRILADVLGGEPNPDRRLVQYEHAIRDAFRTEWEELLAADRADYARFQAAAGLAPPTPAVRALSWFQDHLVNQGMLAEPALQRALLQGYFGLTKPSEWMRHPANWVRIGRALFPSREVAAAAARNRVRPTRDEIASWKAEPASA